MSTRHDRWPLHRRLPPNRRGRDFFAGDLHGHVGSLWRELDAAAFDPACDRLICVGDLVDRGPDSIGCMRLVNEPWFFAVRGNHEQMMLDFLGLAGTDRERYGEFWADRNGGGWFCELAGSDPVEALRLGDLAARLPLALTVPGPPAVIGVVHAGLPAGFDSWDDLVALCESPAGPPAGATGKLCSALVWNRDRILGQIATTISGIDAVVAGHTPVPEPLVLGNSLFIDTGVAYAGGRLTLLSAHDVAVLAARGGAAASTGD